MGITQHVRVLGPDHNSGLVMTPLDNNLAGLHQSDNTAAAAAALLITSSQIIHFIAQFAPQYSSHDINVQMYIDILLEESSFWRHYHINGLLNMVSPTEIVTLRE